ncbi:MAG: glutamate racemase [Saprospiraceae bacterium]|nr:glutamate racemase [Saprospiraceae bacterium]
MTDPYSPIGVFDSGSGGLTILDEFLRVLPQYDYLYLGDHARAPYGPRSFETIYDYTLEAVEWFFAKGCQLVIIACNTASAKALRSIQQLDLNRINSSGRVLGVIRPTTEQMGHLTKSGHVGIFATTGTVNSNSYVLELDHLWPELKVTQQACPMWVPLIENNEHLSEGSDYFVKKYIDALLHQDALIDTILLGCTHYPLMEEKIKEHLPPHIQLVCQGPIVAKSLKNYLLRHPEIESVLSKNAKRAFFTTESTANFDDKALIFFSQNIQSMHLDLQHTNTPST